MKWTNSQKYKLTKLTQEEIENHNKPTADKKIELLTKKNIPTKKSPGSGRFTD